MAEAILIDKPESVIAGGNSTFVMPEGFKCYDMGNAPSHFPAGLSTAFLTVSRNSEVFLVVSELVTGGTLKFRLYGEYDIDGSSVGFDFANDDGAVVDFVTITAGGPISRKFGNVDAATYGFRPIPCRCKRIRIKLDVVGNLTSSDGIFLITG